MSDCIPITNCYAMNLQMGVRAVNPGYRFDDHYRAGETEGEISGGEHRFAATTLGLAAASTAQCRRCRLAIENV